MAWIKENPHLLTLTLVAVGVVGASAMLVMNTQHFDSNFEEARQTPVKQTKVYVHDQSKLESAKNEFKTPAVWAPPGKGASLFVSERYMVSQQNPNQLVPPETGSIHPDSYSKKPIPNEWFLTNKLPLFNAQVPMQDPDNDGFLNEDEWRGNTNPSDAKSHPPYYTLLFLKEFRKIPFLLKFQAYDGDPAKDKKEDMQFQINALSLKTPSVFLKIGEMVPKTKFKIVDFKFNQEVSPNGAEVDRSELTILDTEFNTSLKLILNTVVDSPDAYAVFTYMHPKTPKDFGVKKLGNFILIPETEQKYKLLDIDDQKALVQTPSGEEVQIPRMPQGFRSASAVPAAAPK